MKNRIFNKLIKPALFTSAVMVFSATAVAAELSDKRLKSLKRDIKVMTNIIKTTLEESVGRNAGQLSGIYIANQGMLFSISAQHHFNHYFMDHVSPVVPLAPKAPLPTKIQITTDNMEEIEESTMQIVEAAMEMAEHQMDVYSDIDWSHYSRRDKDEFKKQQKMLRSQHRELERQARGLERDVRDIERKIRDAEFEQELRDGEQNKSKIASLEKELAGLTNSLTGVIEQIQKKADDLRKKTEEARKKQTEKQQKQLIAMEQAISQTVCDFGAGLRSLPKGEHISFNIEGRQNRLYVFDQKSIIQCADGDIDAKKLLEKAVKYSM